MHLSNIEVRQLLRTRYPDALWMPLEADYDVPTERAFDIFRDEFGRHMLSLCGDKWFDFYDCNRFALEAMSYANIKHMLARRAGQGQSQGVGFFMLCFQLRPGDPTSGHAINTRIRPDRSVMEFEPQNRKDLPLTQSQCASAWLLFG